jgi:Ala-tRNA(Pro) deacylase
MATPKWLRNMFQARGINYMELHHRDVPTSQEVAHQEHISGHRVAKVVVVMADGKPVELVLPASQHVHLDRVRQILGAKEVRLANEMEMEHYFPDCEVGAIPPVRHWKGIGVFMDRTFDVEGDIVFQAGTHKDAFRLNFRDWFETVKPRVVSFVTPMEPVET